MFGISVTTEKTTAVPEASQRTSPIPPLPQIRLILNEATGQVLPQCGKAAGEPGTSRSPAAWSPRLAGVEDEVWGTSRHKAARTKVC